MKKKILALTILASLVLTIAACGDDSNDTSSASNSSAPAGTTTAATTGNGSPEATTSAADSTDPTTPTTGNTDPGTDPTDPGSDPTDPGSDPTEEDPLFSDDEVELFIVKGHAEIDGVKDEAWNNAQTVSLELIKKDNPSPDTEVKASVMWDEEAIYFLFEITDSQFFHGGSVGDFNNDGIYIYFSEDVELYAPDAASYGWGAYQFALINKDLEMLPRKPESGANLEAQSAYNFFDGGAIIEFSYKFTDYELAANRFVAVDFQYNDCDESSMRLGALSWYNGTDGDFNTLNLAIAKLVEKLPG